MAKQIKNRREDLYINDVPPEILDETTLSADGFVKNTDYPSTSAAGVIKLNPNRAVSHANGALQAIVVTAENYGATNNAAFISKGTLENVIQDVIERMLAAALDDSYTAAEVGTTWRILLRKAEGGPSIDFSVQT